MIASPVVGILGYKYNRAHLIAIGELVVGVACLLSSIPYFVYGPSLHFLHQRTFNNSTTSYDLCLAKETDQCSAPELTGTVYFAVVILWLASFANGFGYSAFYTVVTANRPSFSIINQLKFYL